MALTVARVRDIPIRLHWTFLLALPVFAWLMAAFYFGDTGATDAWAWTWGALLAIALFGSVLLHELAHSIVAQRNGVPIEHITLLPIGGVSAFEEMPRDPGTEFRISVVGPITNLVLAAPLFAWVLVGVPAFVPLFPEFVLRLAQLNLVIGLFNLVVPAFPMDGGRILRAALAHRLGRLRATTIAATVGRGVALAMGLLGLFTGAWLLVLVAVFVYMGARQEEAQTRLVAMLSAFHVRDVMSSPVDTLPPDATVSDALDDMLMRKRVALAVVDDDGPRGLVVLGDVQSVPMDARRDTPVSAIMRTTFETLRPDDAGEDAARVLRTGAPALVLDEGRLVGIVTPRDLERVSLVAQAKRGRGAAGHA